MTDPAHPLPGVLVTGQRKSAPSPFAEIKWPTTSGTVDQNQVELPDGESGTQPSDEDVQCQDEEGRRQWNADALAQGAIDAFIEAARLLGEPDLANREFGALICEFSDGSMSLGPVESGEPTFDQDGQQVNLHPTVPLSPSGCGGGTPVGYIHSHPGLNTFLPSDRDFNFAQGLIDSRGANQARFGIYVVSRATDSHGRSEYHVGRSKIDDRAAAAAGTLQPSWVNPDAQGCPADQGRSS